MNFSRKNLETLRQIKLKARNEVAYEVNFASSTLEEDLKILANMQVTSELQELIKVLLPGSQADVSNPYLRQNRAESNKEKKSAPRLRYRGQLVEA